MEQPAVHFFHSTVHMSYCRLQLVPPNIAQIGVTFKIDRSHVSRGAKPLDKQVRTCPPSVCFFRFFSTIIQSYL
jgi:hypothetical protein